MFEDAVKNIFTKTSIILALILVFNFLNLAQTTLSAGDIAIVGFNSDNPDEFAFVCLVNIDAGTVIRFTDAGWLSSGGFWAGYFGFLYREGAVTFTAGSNYNAGDVIIYSGIGGEWSTYSESPLNGSFSLSTSGDQIIAFQGTATSPAPIIYAVNFNGSGIWQSTANDENTSALPVGLIDGFSSLALNEIDNAVYFAGAKPDLNSLRTAIGNISNWTGSNNSRYDLTVQFIGPLPVELTTFSAVIKNKTVNLNWVTETEVNSCGFEVQRSAEPNKWEVLGFVEGAGNSNSPKEYSYTDDKVNPANAYKYRLRMIDNDGSYEYSKIIEVNFSIPTTTDLMQNYPNPFNPTTTISFTLPESGNVTLKIFNPLGEEIATLVNSYTEAGVHVFNFNAGNLPSGMYIYQLKTNSNTLTKKMLFLK